MKENVTVYEWDYETQRIDEEGEIEFVDHDHSDHFLGFPDSYIDDDGIYVVLVLVKDVYRNWCLENRSWAYVEDRKLPEFFSDAFGMLGDKVPQRFHKEIEKVVS